MKGKGPRFIIELCLSFTLIAGFPQLAQPDTDKRIAKSAAKAATTRCEAETAAARKSFQTRKSQYSRLFFQLVLQKGQIEHHLRECGNTKDSQACRNEVLDKLSTLDTQLAQLRTLRDSVDVELKRLATAPAKGCTEVRAASR